MSIKVNINRKLEEFNLDVSFETNSRCTGILGASGCGKSMTLKCIAGLEKPSSGIIKLNEMTFYSSEEKINLRPQLRRVGYLFQDYALFPHMTVAENIMIGLEKKNIEEANIDYVDSKSYKKSIISKKEGRLSGNIPKEIYSLMGANARQRSVSIGNFSLSSKKTMFKKYMCRKTIYNQVIDKLITKFHLEGLKDRYPSELSGGQKQRVALARIFAYEPEVLLLDEPFSALDNFLKDELTRELIQILKGFKGHMIMVSHSREELYTCCDDLIVMDKGKVLVKGETKSVFKLPIHHIAAKVTGCKNISRVTKVDDYHLLAHKWGIHLKTSIPILDEIKYVGIRAHDIEWNSIEDNKKIETYELEKDSNTFVMKVRSYMEYPFESEYMLEASKQAIDTLFYKGIMTKKCISSMGVVRIPSEKLLLLI